METVNINLDDKQFTFRVKETVKDRNLIKAEASDLVGGRLRLSELNTALDEAMDKYIAFNQKKFGDEYKEKSDKFTKLQKEKKFDSDEYKQLFEELNTKNPHFYVYFDLLRERNNVYAYARLKVLCEQKPTGYEFEDEDELQKLLSKLEQNQIFFRK